MRVQRRVLTIGSHLEAYPRLLHMTSRGSGAASASQAVLSWCSIELDATACSAQPQSSLSMRSMSGKLLR